MVSQGGLQNGQAASRGMPTEQSSAVLPNEEGRMERVSPADLLDRVLHVERKNGRHGDGSADHERPGPKLGTDLEGGRRARAKMAGKRETGGERRRRKRRSKAGERQRSRHRQRMKQDARINRDSESEQKAGKNYTRTISLHRSTDHLSVRALVLSFGHFSGESMRRWPPLE